jgi:hypothetical protein
MATYLPSRFWHHLRQWLKAPISMKTRYLQGRLVAARNLALGNRTKEAIVTAPPPPDVGTPKLPFDIDYYHAVALNHRFRQYPGSVDFFVGDEAIYGWRWYWRHLARGGISFLRIRGPHHEVLLHPYVAELSQTFCKLLERRQREDVNHAPKNVPHGPAA